MELHVKVGAPLEVGAVPRGRRRIVPIEGGTFEGPGLRGTVLPGGADWQIVRSDGLAELDTRYTLKTEAGDMIYIQNAGMRHAPPDITRRLLAGQDVDPSLVYFRTVPTFETEAPHLQWLTRAISSLPANGIPTTSSSEYGRWTDTFHHRSNQRTRTVIALTLPSRLSRRSPRVSR